MIAAGSAPRRRRRGRARHRSNARSAATCAALARRRAGGKACRFGRRPPAPSAPPPACRPASRDSPSGNAPGRIPGRPRAAPPCAAAGPRDSRDSRATAWSNACTASAEAAVTSSPSASCNTASASGVMVRRACHSFDFDDDAGGQLDEWTHAVPGHGRVRGGCEPGQDRTPAYPHVTGGLVAARVGDHSIQRPVTAGTGQLAYASMLADGIAAWVLKQPLDCCANRRQTAPCPRACPWLRQPMEIAARSSRARGA